MALVGTKVAPVMDAARDFSCAVQAGVDNTRRAIKQAGETVADVYDRTRETVADTYDTTVTQVRKHPMRSMAFTLLIGVGIGMGAGLLIGRIVFKRPMFGFFK